MMSRRSGARPIEIQAPSRSVPAGWRTVVRSVIHPSCPVPQRALPAVDHAVVAAKRALPCDLSRPTVKVGDDLAQAPFAARTPPAHDICVPSACGTSSPPAATDRTKSRSRAASLCASVTVADVTDVLSPVVCSRHGGPQ